MKNKIIWRVVLKYLDIIFKYVVLPLPASPTTKTDLLLLRAHAYLKKIVLFILLKLVESSIISDITVGNTKAMCKT